MKSNGAVPLNPLFDRVLLRREKIGARSSLIIPETAEKRNAPAKGIVVATGPGADESIEVGMTVIFGQFAGAWVNADGTIVPQDEQGELFVCQDVDIIAEVKSHG